MKKTYFLKGLSLFTALILSALMFTACAGRTMTVNINDAGVITPIEANDGMTVSEILEKAEIKLGSKDVTDPAPNTKWADAKTTEINIKRYAKVTVVKGQDEKTVELVGGTVEQAVKEAGYALGNGVEADAEADAFLKDGMKITVYVTSVIKVTDAGKTKEYSTTCETVEDFLKENKITVGKEDEINVKNEDEIKDGLKIVIKRVTYKTEKETKEINFKTEERTDSNLEAGQTVTQQQGVKGTKEISYKVKYINGKEKSREKVGEKVTKEPVNEIVVKGTKVEQATEAPQQSSQQSSQVQQSQARVQPATQAPTKAAGKTVVSKQKVLDCDGSGHGYYVIKYSDGTESYEEF